jgi:hypothetical protein
MPNAILRWNGVQGGPGAIVVTRATARRRKLMDAVASRVGASLPLYLQGQKFVGDDKKQSYAKQKDGKNKTTHQLISGL